jgi:hypothetical protein
MPAENGDPGAWLRGQVPGTAEEVARLVQRAREIPPLEQQALVAQVSAPEYERYDAGVWAPFAEPKRASRPYRVVLIDVGVKHNIPRSLARRGLETIIVPYDTSAADIAALEPDGVVLGNGPGDPDGDPSLKPTIETVRRLIEGPVRQRQMPLTAVCLGHQVLGLAIGAGPAGSNSAIAAPTIPSKTCTPAGCTSRRRTTGSRSTVTPSHRRAASRSATSTSTTARWKGWSTARCRCSPSSTTRRPVLVRRTISTSLIASSRRWRPARVARANPLSKGERARVRAHVY